MIVCDMSLGWLCENLVERGGPCQPLRRGRNRSVAAGGEQNLQPSPLQLCHPVNERVSRLSSQWDDLVANT